MEKLNCEKMLFIGWLPKTNAHFWIEKITFNVERDKINAEKLTVAGWNVLIVWECEIRHVKDINPLVERLSATLLSNQSQQKSYEEGRVAAEPKA